MSGPFDPAFGSKFGVADYDWSNQKQLWVNAKPMDCEALLVARPSSTARSTRIPEHSYTAI